MKDLLSQVDTLDKDRRLGGPDDKRSTAALDLIRSWKYAKAKAGEVRPWSTGYCRPPTSFRPM